MTEKIPHQHLTEKGRQIKSPQLDPLIDHVLVEFEKKYLPETTSFWVSNIQDRGEEVDKVCWELGLNRNVSRKGVNLRALYLVRQIDVATRELSDDESWEWGMGMDRFWSQVDPAMLAFLHKNADKIYRNAPAHEQIVGENNDIVCSEQLIAEMNGRRVTRKTYRNIASDTPHYVYYIVPPEAE